MINLMPQQDEDTLHTIARQTPPGTAVDQDSNTDFAAIRRESMSWLFGACIKSCCEKCGRSIEEAATAAGMEAAAWAAVEAGIVPNPASLRSIATGIGATIYQIAPLIFICQDAWQ
jgi:2-keto-3-deoxy-galactonokinase